MRDLTDMQAKFAVEYAANAGNASAAARAAGYSGISAHEIGSQLLEKPHVQEAIMKELIRLRYKSGTVGLNAMLQLAANEKTPAAARVSAARSLMEHAGLLGSAKEVIAAREEAEKYGGEVVDYRKLLDDLAKAGKRRYTKQPDELEAVG